MKHPNSLKILITAFVAVISSAVTSPTFADTESTTWFGEEADGQWLAGIKFGVTENNRNGYNSASGATLVVGYQFSSPIGEGGTASVELELGSSETATIGAGNDFGTDGVWSTDTTAIYLTYRSPGTIYFKGKAGILDSNINSEFPLGSVESNDTNFSYGLGVGYRMGGERDVNIEAEWIGTSGDHDLNKFNVGAHLNF